MDLNFRTLFEAGPSLYLVLAADPARTILAVSEAYLNATMTKRDVIVGRGMFDVFPDNPADPHATGTRNLEASIARVIATQQPDTMAVQKYDVRRPDGSFEERWWLPSNTPVLDASGDVRYIVHRAEDVTELARARREGVALEARIATEQQQADLRFRDLVDLAPDGVIVSDPTGKILLVNIAAERMFGFSRTELLGRSVEMLMPERARAHHAEHMARFVASPSSRPMGSGLELTGLRRDGREFPIEVSLSPMHADGRLSILTALRDITERRKIERDLERLAAIVDSSDDAIISETLAGEITSWNVSAERMFDYRAQEMLGASVARLLPEGGMSEERGGGERNARGEKVAAFETQRRRRDGTTVDVSIRLSPIIERGRVVGASKVVRDITEQRRMAEETRRANAYLASAVESIQDAFALYDEHDRVVLVNSAFRQTFGSGTDGPIIGRSFADVLDDSLRTHLFVADDPAALRARLIASHTAPAGPVELRTASGRIFRLYDQTTPEGGRVSLYVDVTVDVIREDELSAARVAAEAASAAKSEFLASMSHELRTPLNAILGFSDLLQRDRKEPASARQIERLGHIHRAGSHLLRLISDILDLSRIESGRLTISAEPVALSSVLAEVISQLQPQATRQQITLGQTSSTDEDAVVVADRTRLSQILMNFGSNALKYGRAHGHAEFRVSRASGNQIRIALADDGIGIPKDKQGKIFEPFQRAGQEAGTIEGTGIGLAISKRLVELMSGGIGFTSEPGRGSEFWIELPEPAAVAAEGESTAAGGPKGMRLSALEREGSPFLLLYIEDNPSNTALMRSLIDDLPRLRMLTATTAEVGLELVRARRPDLVIMDINLPGMSGIEAMRKLAASDDTRDIPVIALSAAALPRDTVHAQEAGFRRYLTKPVNVDELTAAFEEILLATHASAS
ncbi:MAG TPA: PAS domain S-box protein [Kofleriaceae bacterium]|nr:PAS domain S-box protein [Kofleriaceae bacterium]